MNHIQKVSNPDSDPSVGDIVILPFYHKRTKNKERNCGMFLVKARYDTGACLVQRISLEQEGAIKLINGTSRRDLDVPQFKLGFHCVVEKEFTRAIHRRIGDKGRYPTV